jgi:hypothetical protein
VRCDCLAHRYGNAADRPERRPVYPTDLTDGQRAVHILAAARTLNRPELVTETLRVSLETLAVAAPSWPALMIDAEWGRRYGRAARYDRLPKDKDELAEYVLLVGADGMLILNALAEPETPLYIKRLPQLAVLRRVWVQQYWTDAHGNLAWRGPKSTKDRLSRRDTPRRATGKVESDGRPDPGTARVPWASVEVVTPHDPEARYCQKLTAAGQRAWIGYRDHQTETCDGDGANVIAHVATAPAPEQDIDAFERIHQGLAAHRARPGRAPCRRRIHHSGRDRRRRRSLRDHADRTGAPRHQGRRAPRVHQGRLHHRRGYTHRHLPE